MFGNAHTGSRRRILTFAALAWLNVAMLPCTMALAESAPDCPDCPQQAHEASSGHHAMHGGGHAEPGEILEPHCGVGSPDCCDVDDFLKENRAAKSDLDPCYAALPALGKPFAGPAAQGLTTPGTGPPPATGHPRLHLLNCVFRD